MLGHRRQAEQQLHGPQHADRRIHLAVDDAALDVRADHQARGAVRVHVIGSVLRVVLDDEDRELAARRVLLVIASTILPTATSFEATCAFGV